MKKAFCDLCGKPALPHPCPYVEAPVGAQQYAADEGKLKQTMVTVTMNLGFRYHPTGFGGPPDICGRCLVKLAQSLVADAVNKKKAGGQ